ncbi:MULTISPECIES: peptidase S10 [unclassified Pseudonocardia]|uniref:S10 family peptidase n=1 Tax=unclassified Pseudonocardia TaxID=2619320 RepID=UPI00094AA790|nr:peptidase S10 [Pseudonocardia sp. Ae707_Ps1]
MEQPGPTPPAHEPPAGVSTTGVWNGLGYRADAQWIVLRQEEKPAAEIFTVSYVAEDRGERPVTFVFGGGPGGASAYLHLGVVGPRRIAFPGDGTMPSPPARLVDNPESWLAFTDLVVVDAVDTGFSRSAPGAEPTSYYGTERDLDALVEVITRWLGDNGRWHSPVLVAGESYGGYRAARLIRRLQESAGIGVSGSILISPALEFAGLSTIGLELGDYDVLPWVDTLPTMALAAAHHGRSRAFGPDTPPSEIRRAAEEFATGEFATFLVRGAATDPADRQRVFERHAALTGLDVEDVARAEGRIRITRFTRDLLRADRLALGIYDATVTTTDPYPDRELYMGADPTLTGIAAAFGAGINQYLRGELGVRTGRTYTLLDPTVVAPWQDDTRAVYNHPPKGATDDLRYGLALNPGVRAIITHGHHDLVTPYHAGDRLRNQMRLTPGVASRLTAQHFDGGHMFYLWDDSRRAFTAAITDFVTTATAR